MIDILSTNITSPLGGSSAENYLAVKEGKSPLKTVRNWDIIPGQVCISEFSPERKKELRIDGFTWFESLVIRSVKEALQHTQTDVSDRGTVFILSTTKCNIQELAPSADADGEYLDPGSTAEKISSYLGFTTTPIVICNACISGVTAQVIAKRLIDAGKYDRAVVCGADTLSAFTVAGFTSFKALSSSECRPFDIERTGLNLGEAAATMILGRTARDCPKEGFWHIVSGYLNNDAYHVSAPAPDGNGVLRAIRHTLGDAAPSCRISTVSAHGTATMFNDQMESKAIQNAGLGNIPVTAFKGIFGHTLGAAGLLEAIVGLHSSDDGIILPVRGFEEMGVSGKITVNTAVRNSEERSFLKIISGFGGCNGAVLYSREALPGKKQRSGGAYTLEHSVSITPCSLRIDGSDVPVSSQGQEMLVEIFRKYGTESPKFYKMDLLSKLAYAASSILLRDFSDRADNPEDIAVIFFNKNSSVVADRQHLGTFVPPEGFYPSPSSFLYTLPNVVMGEIAARYNIRGETTFIILPRKDEWTMDAIITGTIADTRPSLVLYGWVDCPDDRNFCAELELIKNN